MQTLYKYTAVVLLAAITAVVFKTSTGKPAQPAQAVMQNTSPASAGSIRGNEALGEVAGAATDITAKPAPKLLMPISEGMLRVTKKSYGLYVTPENSPVDNDIFIGFHTGIDFETNTSEQNKEIIITAACDGIALLKQWAAGYGGVFVQSCKIDGEDVTVIYGHLNLASITLTPGQTVLAGDRIGSLGEASNHETDGRRKHLHFDIHKGTEINILGYVANQEELANWIDPIKYLE